MAAVAPTPAIVFAVATCVKLLLIPSYHSTDFEVHRNWLALTHSLPPSAWYYEETSKWTLDYPPFFAWFEWGLSWPAALADENIVKIDNHDYGAPSCVLFQRISVIISDLVLLYSVIQYCKWKKFKDDLHSFVISSLVLMNTGLFLVDHIHFQYNGFLYGILLLSIVKMLQAAGLFVLLLNLKHIYIYVAPAFFVYLLKHHCFSLTASGSSQHFSLIKFMELAAVVTGIFALSFGPFIYFGQLSQVLSRLFPFKRGLCHAYWAPNFWALYSALDKLLAILGFSTRGGGSMTSGLVGEMQLEVLPSIPPVLAVILTATAIMPSVVKLLMKKNTCGSDFLHCLVLCGYASFMFGWHVHEKAVMMVTIPMCLLAMEDDRLWRVFTVVSTVAHISLFPLLFNTAETLIKVFLFVPYLMVALVSHTLLKGNNILQWELKSLAVVCTGACVLVQIFCLFIHGVGGFLSYLEFLPLLLTSFTCALGVTWTWLLTFKIYFAI